MKKRLRLIWDDGTPRCLPDWACQELVRHRLEACDLRDQINKLYQRLHEAGDENALTEMMAAAFQHAGSDGTSGG